MTSRRWFLFLTSAIILGFIRLLFEPGFINFFHIQNRIDSPIVYYVLLILFGALPVFFFSVKQNTKRGAAKIIGLAMLAVLITELVLASAEYFKWYGKVFYDPDGLPIDLFAQDAVHAIPVVALFISVFAGLYAGVVVIFIHLFRMALKRIYKK